MEITSDDQLTSGFLPIATEGWKCQMSESTDTGLGLPLPSCPADVTSDDWLEIKALTDDLLVEEKESYEREQLAKKEERREARSRSRKTGARKPKGYRVRKSRPHRMWQRISDSMSKVAKRSSASYYKVKSICRLKDWGLEYQKKRP